MAIRPPLSWFAIAVSAVFVVARPLGLGGVIAQQPTFRARTDVVYVTATVVAKDGHLVTDLTKDDFEIRDNGEPREIIEFHNDVVPFAITIMFDTSGSITSMDGRGNDSGNLFLMRRGVGELVSRFGPGDRAKIGTFGAGTMITPSFSANPRELVSRVNATIAGVGVACVSSVVADSRLGAGGSSIWDAIGCGIESVAVDAETPRRVVMVLTDGIDHGSTKTPEDIRRLAAKFGVMVYVIGVSGFEGLDAPGLRELAEETGGGYFHVLDTEDLVPTFVRIADELRHQYVFGFAPTLVDAPQHRLDVSAKGVDVTTRARRVYLEADPIAVATTVSPPTTTSRPTPVAASNAARPLARALLESYSSGDWDSAGQTPTSFDALWRFFNDLKAAAPAWIRAGGAADEPRRRLAASTFVLDLIDRHGQQVWEPLMTVSDLVEWACGLLREGPSLAAERTWYRASVAVLEAYEASGRGQVGGFSDVSLNTLATHMSHAEARVPGDAQWALARAFSQEQHVWPWPTRPLPWDGELVQAIRARYEDAFRSEGGRAEAHVRWGYLELHSGRVQEALRDFDAAGTPDDSFVRYWLHLFRGRALQRVGRVDDAIADYRLAFAEVPYAQSATIGLGLALISAHRPDEAAALTTRMLALRPAPIDPWTIYAAPAYREWPALIASLRAEVKR